MSEDKREKWIRFVGVIVLIALGAVCILAKEVFADATCEPWSDTVNQYDGERADTNILKCASPADCKTKMAEYIRTYGASRTSGEVYISYQSYARCRFHRPTPPPPPPSAEWTVCAQENEVCTVPTPPRNVRYGAGSTWITRSITTPTVRCDNATFTDPAPFVPKRCEWSGTSSPPPPPPAPTGILMQWTAPTLDIHGNPLPANSIRGYGIYYSQDLNTLGAGGQFIEVPGANAYRITLTPGTWYIAVTALMQGGEISALSNIVRREVR